MSLLAGIGGLLGTAGTIYGAYSASRNQREANKIAQQSAAEQAALSQRMLDMQSAPRVNARGDRSGFENGQWFVDLSPMGQSLQNASDEEELLRLVNDLSMRRSGIERNFERRSDEGVYADQLLRQLSGPEVYTPEGMADRFQTLAAKGISDRYDDITNRTTTQALRTGTSAAPILASLGQQQADDMVTAMLQAEIQGLGFGQQLEQGRTGNLLNQYNTMASRASNIDDTPFAPSTAGVNAENNNAAMAGGMLGAGQLAAYGNQNANNTLMQATAAQRSPWPSALAGVGGMLTQVDTMFGDRKNSNSTTTDIN